jgi:Membrane-associating domain
MLNGVISWAVDGLASLILLAGGLAFAIGLKGTNCSDPNTTVQNSLLNCGSTGKPNSKDYTTYCKGAVDEKTLAAALNGRCREATADDAFLFMAFVASLGALIATFVMGRKRVGGSFV